MSIDSNQIKKITDNPNITSGKEVHQKTVMFDNSDKLMEHTDGRIRLRQQGDKISLSYKRPLPSVGNEKKEVELETEVGNFEVMTHILRMMGYSPSTSYEKYTLPLRMKNYNDIHIEIQKYPFENFLEIEGDKEKIEKAAKQLGFDIKDALVKPVDTLFTEWRLAKGLPFKPHMAFKDYDK
ncbi:MAG: class IV adenylate cyclase [Candidatus Pacebacteria bacterium]|nr:class IV adenylate cyclase [Candidatus Paceibacterota bacterium]